MCGKFRSNCSVDVLQLTGFYFMKTRREFFELFKNNFTTHKAYVALHVASYHGPYFSRL